MEILILHALIKHFPYYKIKCVSNDEDEIRVRCHCQMKHGVDLYEAVTLQKTSSGANKLNVIKVIWCFLL